MKTKLLLLVLMSCGSLLLYGEESDQESSSPLMMLGKGKREKTIFYERASTSEATDAGRRNAEEGEEEPLRQTATAVEKEASPVASQAPQSDEEKRKIEKIFARRYMLLDPEEFKIIAGKSRMFKSRQYKGVGSVVSYIWYQITKGSVP